VTYCRVTIETRAALAYFLTTGLRPYLPTRVNSQNSNRAAPPHSDFAAATLCVALDGPCGKGVATGEGGGAASAAVHLGLVSSAALPPPETAVDSRDLGARARGVGLLWRSAAAANAAAAAWNAGSAVNERTAARSASNAFATADGDDFGRSAPSPVHFTATAASRMMRPRGEGTPGHTT
jgi:hypothetical protein